MTPQEVRLWAHLKQMRRQGFHFRRQTPFLAFYLDFACFKKRLVIEVDGSQHSEEGQERHDAMRDAILQRRGFRTLRFRNNDINTEFDGVVRAIDEALNIKPLPPHHGEGRRGEAEPGWGSQGKPTDASDASDIPTRPGAHAPVHPPHEGEGGT